jgi:hypothetical protein
MTASDPQAEQEAQAFISQFTQARPCGMRKRSGYAATVYTYSKKIVPFFPPFGKIEDMWEALVCGCGRGASQEIKL